MSARALAEIRKEENYSNSSDAATHMPAGDAIGTVAARFSRLRAKSAGAAGRETRPLPPQRYCKLIVRPRASTIGDSLPAPLF